MTWLAIDTATGRASVAVGRTAADAREHHIDGARSHARLVLPAVEALLAEAGVALRALRGIIIADGPGSFTGLRVSAALAKGLHDGTGLPVLSAPSLKGRACAAAAGGAATVLATSDALRGDVYAAVYRFGAGVVDTLAEPAVVPAAGAAALAPGARSTDGVAADARMLIALAGLAGGVETLQDVAGWSPAYGRPAEAAAQWELRHGRPLENPPGLAR